MQKNSLNPVDYPDNFESQNEHMQIKSKENVHQSKYQKVIFNKNIDELEFLQL